ncbi:MAG TPA: hypothetical protein VED01_13975 [Burkholderiales bacterium]|nr:hypothetical protein [Burkholderiales bacterium]
MEPHRWKFIRAGGVDQVVIRNGADIANLEQLDQKLWVALACPTRDIEFDTATLDLLDSDNDGRIRAPEVIEASRWVRARLKNLDDLFTGGDTIEISALDDSTPEGSALAAEARDVLDRAGKPHAGPIGLADVAERIDHFDALPFNGDGVVPAAAAQDETLERLVNEIIETHGSVTDRSGHPGIDRAKLDAFFTEAHALEQWRSRGEADPATLPLGEATLGASEAALAVREKIDDYFARTTVTAYDPAAVAALNPARSVYRDMATQTLRADSPEIADLPLAIIEPGRPLPLTQGVNPAWRGRLDALRERVLEPLLGRIVVELTEEDWRSVQAKLAPCEKWLDSRPQTSIVKLGLDRVREIVQQDLKGRLYELIAKDEDANAQSARLRDLEKLVRFKRDLVHFLNNFVSFSEFYRREHATFQAGTLYLDARSCDLTVRVHDAAKHATLAGLAKAYLAYLDCTRGKDKMTIAAAFTAGDVDYLLVGRNGVFYDRKGRDWDATITKIVENPISIRQAFFSPYKKFVRMIEEQVAKRAGAADKDAQGKLSALAANVAKPSPPAQAPAAAARQRRIDVGTVAALGVALGSISTVIVGVFSKFIDLGLWIPLALVGIVLAISGPSVVIAWLKLRQRSLGPILDASGWAINGRMRINVPLGASLSRMPKLPPRPERQRRDPFAESHAVAYAVLLALTGVAALLFAWRSGWLPIGP